MSGEEILIICLFAFIVGLITGVIISRPSIRSL